MTDWPDIPFSESFSVEQILAMNQACYPFWIRSYRTRHVILKVVGFYFDAYQVIAFHPYNLQQIGRGVTPKDNSEGWIPIDLGE
jgi:hypothetical protein